MHIGRCHKQANNAHIMDWSAMHCTAFRPFKTPFLHKMYKELSKILIAAHCLESSNEWADHTIYVTKKYRPQLIAIIVLPLSSFLDT